MRDLPAATGPFPVDGLARTRAELLLGADERGSDPLRRGYDKRFDAPGSTLDLREIVLARLAQLTARLGSVARRDATRSIALDGTAIVVLHQDIEIGRVETASGRMHIEVPDGLPSVAAGWGEGFVRVATWWAAGMPSVDGARPLDELPEPVGGYVRVPDIDANAPLNVDARLASAAAAALSVASAEVLDALGPETRPEPDAGRIDRAIATVLGGALGDALGAPIEFASTAQITSTHGLPLRTFLPLPGAPTGAVTDDTQMTLFTAEALADPHVDLADADAVRARVALAYLDWYSTQGGTTRPTGTGSALLAERWLHARRAPGIATMGALEALAHADADPASIAQNDSKGCGTVMRSAAFALPSEWSAVDAYRAAASSATITHAHPEAAYAAGAFAALISCLLAGGELLASVWTAIRLTRWAAGQTTLTVSRLESAVALAATAPGDVGALARIGEGWVAEEALGIAVYAALSFPTAEGVGDALSLAVAHGGDSDSTGSIAGNILGAAWGTAALPAPLVDAVEGRATIERVARLLARREDTP